MITLHRYIPYIYNNSFYISNINNIQLSFQKQNTHSESKQEEVTSRSCVLISMWNVFLKNYQRFGKKSCPEMRTDLDVTASFCTKIIIGTDWSLEDQQIKVLLSPGTLIAQGFEKALRYLHCF